MPLLQSSQLMAKRGQGNSIIHVVLCYINYFFFFKKLKPRLQLFLVLVIF